LTTLGRWSVYIDVEGFSAIHRQSEVRALQLLGKLMEAVYLVGIGFPTDTHECLFVHQIGDGFLIVSSFPEPTLQRPLAIAVGLMQHLLVSGGVGRCGISAGTFADVSSCYPDAVKKSWDANGCLRLGNGLMTTFPVMGTALINSFKAQQNGTKGPLLFIDPAFANLVTNKDVRYLRRDRRYVVVDWINSQPPLLDIAFKALGSKEPEASQLRWLLQSYVSETEPRTSNRWRHNALKMAKADEGQGI